MLGARVATTIQTNRLAQAHQLSHAIIVFTQTALSYYNSIASMYKFSSDVIIHYRIVF